MTSTRSLPDAPRLRSVIADLPPYIAGHSAQTALTAALASNESHFSPLPSVTEIITAVASLADHETNERILAVLTERGEAGDQ